MGGLKPAEFEPEDRFKLTSSRITDSIKQNFPEGVRVLMLIHRNKDGSTWKNRHVDMRIARDWPEFEKELAILEQKMWSSSLNLRIYCTVNPRSMNKAIREFKRQQADMDYNSEDIRDEFYIKMKNRFIGCLMKPSCKESTIFKFDIDSPDIMDCYKFEGVLSNYTTIITTRQTPNGWHIFTEPFNHTKVEKGDIEFQPDSMILLDFKM